MEQFRLNVGQIAGGQEAKVGLVLPPSNPESKEGTLVIANQIFELNK